MSNFLAAAKATTKPPLSHQQAAWDYAWDLLSIEEKETFLDKFRADPAAKITSQWQPAINLIREYEGLELTAYPDPATGGAPWTIGYGFTFWLNGSKVKPGETITRNLADHMLQKLIETEVVPTLANTIPGWKTLSINRQNALISFSWNVGWHFYGTDGFKTISKCLRESNYDAMPDAMMLYVNPGSNVEAGLRRRRQAEAGLWCISK
jgi:lysozyme